MKLHSVSEYLLTARAALWLTLTRWLLRVSSYRKTCAVVHKLSCHPIPGRRRTSPSPADIDLAVRRASRIVPGARCLAQAVAANAMLGRAGVLGEIRFAVRRTSDGLIAHAWVERDGALLCGDPPGPDATVLPSHSR